MKSLREGRKVWGMQKTILMIVAVVMGQSVLAADGKLIADPIVEKAVRERLNKPTGELTKADLRKVTRLNLGYNKLTDVVGLEKLTQLTELFLNDNPDLTKSQIDELQKALPRCYIIHDFE